MVRDHWDKPIAIYDVENANLFHSQKHQVREAWNKYAQAEADKFNAEDPTGRDYSTRTVVQWVPPLTFKDWFKRDE